MLSSTHALRVFFNQRLSAAVEEIFGAVEKTIVEYQEEVSRSHYEVERLQRMLENVLKQDTSLHKAADPQQLTVSGEEVGPEQQDWSPSWSPDILEPPVIKVEQEECEPDHGGELLQGLEASLDSMLSPPYVKSDHDDEALLRFSEQQHFNQTQENRALEDPQVSQSASASGEFSAVDLDCTATQSQNSGREGGASPSDSKPKKFCNARQLTFNHLGVKSYSCYTCRKVFPNKPKLQVHMRTHAGEKPYHCHMNVHLRTHASENLYKRHEYDKELGRNETLEAQSEASAEPLSRPTTNLHAEPYSCHACSKVFKHKANLQIHTRTHTGEKPYDCYLCGKGFTQLGNLNIHMRIHTGDRPFQCHLCDHKCVHSGNLKKHMRTHTKEKPYKCHVCGKEFSYSNTLKDHMKSH